MNLTFFLFLFSLLHPQQPHAFQSRDFLRKLAVGKEVQFNILYSVGTANREHGLVTLPDGSSLLETLVSEGMVKLREDAAKRSDQGEDGPFVEKLRIYEDQAQTAQKGQWSTDDDGLIDAQYDSPRDPHAFLEEHKEKHIDCGLARSLSLNS